MASVHWHNTHTRDMDFSHSRTSRQTKHLPRSSNQGQFLQLQRHTTSAIGPVRAAPFRFEERRLHISDDTLSHQSHQNPASKASRPAYCDVFMLCARMDDTVAKDSRRMAEQGVLACRYTAPYVGRRLTMRTRMRMRMRHDYWGSRASWSTPPRQTLSTPMRFLEGALRYTTCTEYWVCPMPGDLFSEVW